jgi:hypothetical protein
VEAQGRAKKRRYGSVVQYQYPYRTYRTVSYRGGAGCSADADADADGCLATRVMTRRGV